MRKLHRMATGRAGVRGFGIGVVAVTALFLAACASTGKVAAPVSSGSAAVMIKTSSPCVPLMPCLNQTLTFARLSDEGGMLSTELYQTPIAFSNRYYLLNAKPGRYVAVAISYSRSIQSSNTVAVGSGAVNTSVSANFSENIIFSEALVKQSLVTVKPGELAVMGEFDVDIQGRMALAPSAAQFLKDADLVQAHYARQLDPELESRGITSRVKFYRGDYGASKRSSDAQASLLKAAGHDIGGQGWHAQIEERAKPR